MNVLQNATAMAPNLTLPFSGNGGVAPYTYSIVAGGIGGTINASTGLYTSPNTTGIDKVRVTDSASTTAQASILVGSPIQLFCDILQNEMSLKSNQIWLWDQKVNIPTDSNLYIAVAMLTCKPFGNSNRFYDGSDTESVNMHATLSVDILSRSTTALDRKEEVVMALMSQYAQSQQELNSFYIGKIPTSFKNLSEIDGAAIPYRYNVDVAIQYFVTKTKAVSYFSSFQTPSVNTNP